MKIDSFDTNSWCFCLYNEAEKIANKYNLLNLKNEDVAKYEDAEFYIKERITQDKINVLCPQFYDKSVKMKILGHHYTKLINREIIESQGLKINSWDNYSESMKKTLENYNVSKSDIQKALFCLKKWYKQKYADVDGTNGGHINFTTYEDEWFKEQYCKIIGGELAEELRMSCPPIYDLLRDNGTAYRLDFLVTVDDMDDPEAMSHAMLVSILSKIIWDKDIPPECSRIIKHNIYPEDISIIPI